MPYGLATKAVIKKDKQVGAVTQDQLEDIPIIRRTSSGVAIDFDGKLDVVLMLSVEVSSWGLS